MTGSEDRYFSLQADIGITKHMGGRKATDELATLCGIGPSQLVLEIGCGVGGTSSHLAQAYDCRVVGIDLSPGMVARASSRALRRGLHDRVAFQVADARHLPFPAGTFDAVIDESVTAFVPDKQQALREYARVTRPGGYVGLNEATWVQPPPAQVVKYVDFIMGGAEFLDARAWRALLDGAALQDVTVRTYPFDAIDQYREELRQLDLGDYVQAWRRFLGQALSDHTYVQFTKDILGDPGSILTFVRCIGHGLYVGRKAAD